LTDPLVGLTAIIVLGVASQWLASRLKVPSILLLLTVGFIAGPITGWLDPDALLGEALIPFVSLAVAIVLFEGGLTLHLRELPEIGSVVGRLITIGAAVTWAVGFLATHYVIGAPWGISLLVGAVLIVTGPTVVGPLLRQIRPKGEAGTALRWEGILIDPVGAVLAVLTFEALIHGKLEQAPQMLIQGILATLAVGVVVGLVSAALLIFMMRRHWIPDQLQSAFALMVVVAAFTGSDLLIEESGLLTVTLLGAYMANQAQVDIRHIAHFKENLQVLLIGTLFILLSARLEMDQLSAIGPNSLLLLAFLVLIARPLGVWLSTIGSKLDWRERLWMMLMAPRGIVAAAVASVFAFSLEARGEPGAELIVPLVFLVIVGTVLFYGLAAGPAALRLGLAERNPQGLLIVGAGPLARAIGHSLQSLDLTVLLVDSNRRNIRQARMDGLPTVHGSAVSESLSEELDLAGIGRMLALTPNDEANALAALNFSEDFGRAEVYQLAPELFRGNDDNQMAASMRGRLLFAEDQGYRPLHQRLQEGEVIKMSTITERYDFEAFREAYGPDALPLFSLSESGQLRVFTTIEKPRLRPGDRLISLVREMNGTEKIDFEEAILPDSDEASASDPASQGRASGMEP
jgi:NhaP-type Na+/H+ or K+/H+ antiporter